MTHDVFHFEPDWVSPPGDTIADLLDERGWSQAEFAVRTGYTTKHVNQLICGKASISEDTALRLERVLGSTAGFWLQRDAQYREHLARSAEQAALSRESNWLAELPLLDMVRFGWVKDCQGSGAAQVAECLAFFGVASVAAWRERYGAPLAALSVSHGDHMQPGAVAAWLRQGERRAATIECTPFSRKAFIQVLKKVRAFVDGSALNVNVAQMTDLCAAAGVAVVWEPELQGCPVSGAVQWLTPDLALLMFSAHDKSGAQFWYAFYHEAAHLLLHGKRKVFLEVERRIDSEAEAEAGAFARKYCRDLVARLPELC